MAVLPSLRRRKASCLNWFLVKVEIISFFQVELKVRWFDWQRRRTKIMCLLGQGVLCFHRLYLGDMNFWFESLGFRGTCCGLCEMHYFSVDKMAEVYVNFAKSSFLFNLLTVVDTRLEVLSSALVCLTGGGR